MHDSHAIRTGPLNTGLFDYGIANGRRGGDQGEKKRRTADIPALPSRRPSNTHLYLPDNADLLAAFHRGSGRIIDQPTPAPPDSVVSDRAARSADRRHGCAR